MYHFLYKSHTFIIFQSPASNITPTQLTLPLHYSKPKMRKLTVTSVFLTCLLLAASQQQYFSPKVVVQAIGSVEFNARTAQPSSRAHTGKVFPTWVEWKKLRKAPSGPNPVGNQYPPSRH